MNFINKWEAAWLALLRCSFFGCTGECFIEHFGMGKEVENFVLLPSLLMQYIYLVLSVQRCIGHYLRSETIQVVFAHSY